MFHYNYYLKELNMSLKDRYMKKNLSYSKNDYYNFLSKYQDSLLQSCPYMGLCFLGSSNYYKDFRLG